MPSKAVCGSVVSRFALQLHTFGNTYRAFMNRPIEPMTQDQNVPLGRFARSIRCDDSGDGHFVSELPEGWDIMGNANGGHMMAMAATAMLSYCGRADPVTLTAHFLKPGRSGSHVIACETVKEGKAFATIRANMSKDGAPVLALVGAFGQLGHVTQSQLLVDAEPPALPPAEACIEMSGSQASPAIFKQVEARLHPDDARYAEGTPSGVAQMRGWFRLKDGEPMTTRSLLFALDAFPPTIFNANLPVKWTPTVEMTAHIRAQPSPGWLRARFTTRFVTGGFLEEDGELWDASGRLVAQSRQLALVPLGA